MSNQYATDGLRVKLAEIQTTIRANRVRLKSLMADRGTLLAALRLFEDQDKPESVSLGSGALSRAILDTIRQAGRPVCARDIAEAMTAGGTPDKREFDALLARVRNGLMRLSDKLDGEVRDRTTYWKVKVNLSPT
jgi:hypothetical protein